MKYAVTTEEYTLIAGQTIPAGVPIAYKKNKYCIAQGSFVNVGKNSFNDLLNAAVLFPISSDEYSAMSALYRLRDALNRVLRLDMHSQICDECISLKKAVDLELANFLERKEDDIA